MPNLPGMALAFLVAALAVGLPIALASRFGPPRPLDPAGDRPARGRWLWLVAPVAIALGSILTLWIAPSASWDAFTATVAMAEPVPGRTAGFFPWLLGLAAIAGVLDSWRRLPIWARLLVRLLASAAIAWTITRHRIANFWEPGESALWMTGLTLAFFAVWTGLSAMSHWKSVRDPGGSDHTPFGPRMVPSALILVFMVGAGLVIGGSLNDTPLISVGFTTGPELAFASAAVCGWWGLALLPGADRIHGSPGAGVGVGVGVTLMGVWLGQAVFLNSMPPLTAAVLLASPLAIGLRRLPVLNRFKGAPGWVLGLALTGAVASAAFLTVIDTSEPDDDGASEADYWDSLGG